MKMLVLRQYQYLPRWQITLTSPCRRRNDVLRSAASAHTSSAAPSHNSNVWRGSSRNASNHSLRRYSSTPILPVNQWLNLSQLGHGSSSSGRDSQGGNGKLNEFGHDYTQIGGPIDKSLCGLSEPEIHKLICARIQFTQTRDRDPLRRASNIREELRRSGVFVNDAAKAWRADGKSYFPVKHLPNTKHSTTIPRMADCQTIEEAIRAIYDNLEKVSPRDISAFWAVVPHLLNSHQTNGNQNLVPQLNSIFNKTMDRIDKFRPRELAQTALAFSKTMNTLGKSNARHSEGCHHVFLHCLLIDKRVAIYQSIANTSMPILSKFEPRDFSNLANAFARAEYVPKFDDGSTLFEHLAEKSIPSLGKFNPQSIATTVWAFTKAGELHSSFFDKIADHIEALDHLGEFPPQALSNMMLAYAKAGVPRLTLFEKVANHVVALHHLRTFNPRDLSNILAAYAKAGVPHSRLFGKVTDHIFELDNLEGFAPQAISNIVWAFAKAEVLQPHLFEKVEEHIVSLDHLGAFKPQELSNMVWAFAKAGILQSNVFEKVADHIVALDSLEGFNEQVVSNMVWGFSRADLQHPQMFEKLIERAIEKPNEFSSRNIENLLRWTK